MLYLEIIIISFIIFNTYSHITFNVSTSCSCTGGKAFARLEAESGSSQNNIYINGKHCIKMLYNILILQNK